MRSRTIGLPSGRQVVVYSAGEGGAPLFWLHSLYGVEADQPVVEALARDRMVFAPLAPGFADLEELEDIRDIHDLTLHYDDILEALQLERVVVAGHSFGALIAAEIAAHTPARVSRLILASPLGLWNDHHPVADLFGIPQAEVPTLLYADPARGQGEKAKPDLETTLALARGMSTVARFLWPIPDRGLSRRLYRVRAPTLVIHGALDRFVPVEYAAEFCARMPTASSVVIRGAGHMLTVEALDDLVQATTKFLSDRVEARA
jgi:pimeloyl-ACP methyl ester carboxylesterase